MRKLVIAAIILFGAPAAAQSDCAGIENDLDRLACYDLASGRTPVSETELDVSGDWDVEIKTSEFKDTTDVFLRVQSEEPLSCGMGFGAPQHATLMLRCMENTTALYISTDCHLASGFQGYGTVEYRIDDRPARSRGFTDSTDNRALGLWRGAQAIPFVKELLGADRLLTRFTPFGESPVTAQFPITGLDTAIMPLREACSW